MMPPASLGGLDILMNNAGITEVWDFLDVTPEQFDQLYQVNIRGQYFCAQQAVRHMLKRGKGAVINMTSVHGFAGMKGHSVYAGTKGAIVAWTREVAIELVFPETSVLMPSHRAGSRCRAITRSTTAMTPAKGQARFPAGE